VPGTSAAEESRVLNKEASAGQIDYDSGEKVYLQIARIIRDRIISGELPVGAQIPSGSQMRKEWGVNRLTGAQAVDELRRSGLVVTRPGVGTFVAATPKLQVVTLRPGDKVIARMPTEEEREKLRTGYLTPVLIVTRANGRVEPYNAAVTVCRAEGLTDPAAGASVVDEGSRDDPFRGIGFDGFTGAVHLMHVALAAQQRGHRGD
jgi:DNA-binding transcriptional regulator YhcF (GntR family)